MPSLHLGKIGGKKATYEIHAFTRDLPFREYKMSEISDSSLFSKLLEERYGLLERGRPIYCTAVKPDVEKRIEANPHDSREGTVHIVAINETGGIECALSIAVDTGAKERGSFIGLPLENKWKRGCYKEGKDLDPFRERYMRAIYGQDRSIRPWEMAELYRHFRRSFRSRDLVPRLGVYIGCYHLIVREAKKIEKTPTWLWVFDAIRPYFNLYKYAGAAVLRNSAIRKHPRLVSPGKKHMKRRDVDGQKALFYKGEKISRNIEIPIPYYENGQLKFRFDNIPFLDGLVDIQRAEEIIMKRPTTLSLAGVEGFGLGDRAKLRIGLGIMARRVFDQDYKMSSSISRLINRWALKMTGLERLEFNDIG